MKKLLAAVLALSVSPAQAVVRKAVPPRPASAVKAAAAVAAAPAKTAALPSARAIAPLIAVAMSKDSSPEAASQSLAAVVGEARFKPRSDAVLVPAYVKTAALTAGLTLAPAAARAAETAAQLEGLPSSVKWAAGVAGGIGFLLGSVDRDSEYAASTFDFPGAMTVGLAAALVAGGAAFGLATGGWLIGGGAIAFGGLLGLMRWRATLPPVRPTGTPLLEGYNRFEAQDPKTALKLATRAFQTAAFSEGYEERLPEALRTKVRSDVSLDDYRYYATRGLREFRHPKGLSQADLRFYRESLTQARPGTFDILVLLVQDLPGEAGGAGVFVVRGADKIRAVRVTDEGFVVDGRPIPASSVRAGVGYAWR